MQHITLGVPLDVCREGCFLWYFCPDVFLIKEIDETRSRLSKNCLVAQGVTREGFNCKILEEVQSLLKKQISVKINALSSQVILISSLIRN